MAQVFGIELSLAKQALIVVLSLVVTPAVAWVLGTSLVYALARVLGWKMPHWLSIGPIRRADFNGSSETLVVSTGTFRKGAGLGLDINGGKVYWGAQTSSTSVVLQSANLDGTGQANIKTIAINSVRDAWDVDVDGLTEGRLAREVLGPERGEDEGEDDRQAHGAHDDGVLLTERDAHPRLHLAPPVL